ncbi:putative oxidoreductase CipA [Xylariaceae sp. AK1471]|nr:putative oxidoreductase CipA [Xylariaceae sp. AK1471]
MSGTNHVKKVAIVGATGTVGKYIVKGLLKGGKHEVTALTRGDAKIPEGVKIAKVSYDDPASLTKALEGQDVLIITMSVRAPKETQGYLIEAAAAAKVPFVLPNEWGIESSHGTLGTDVMMGPALTAAKNKIEELGSSSWIGMVTGYWHAYSLASPEAFGFDLKNKTVTFFDEGTVKINSITWERTGQAVASLLSLPIEPETPGAPALSNYKNKNVYVTSWLMSQKDMFKQVLRVSGTKESDWAIKYENAVERYEEAKKRLFAGDHSAFQRLLYTRTFYNNGDGDFESRHGLDNDKLGLPKETQESLDAETKHAFELVESGYTYGG